MSGTGSCGPCKRTSDNKFWDCPPRMADGRLFTDYRPRCDVDLQLVPNPAATNSYSYRQFLINNAENVMAAHRSQAFTESYCGPCVQPYDIGTMLPESTKFVCDESTCKMIPGMPGGSGTGREYGSSAEQQAARDHFLRQQMAFQASTQSSKNCCAVPSASAQDSQRATVPSGGRAHLLD